jgi:hypothetical protein
MSPLAKAASQKPGGSSPSKPGSRNWHSSRSASKTTSPNSFPLGLQELSQAVDRLSDTFVNHRVALVYFDVAPTARRKASNSRMGYLRLFSRAVSKSTRRSTTSSAARSFPGLVSLSMLTQNPEVYLSARAAGLGRREVLVDSSRASRKSHEPRSRLLQRLAGSGVAQP